MKLLKNNNNNLTLILTVTLILTLTLILILILMTLLTMIYIHYTGGVAEAGYGGLGELVDICNVTAQNRS